MEIIDDEDKLTQEEYLKAGFLREILKNRALEKENVDLKEEIAQLVEKLDVNRHKREKLEKYVDILENEIQGMYEI